MEDSALNSQGWLEKHWNKYGETTQNITCSNKCSLKVCSLDPVLMTTVNMASFQGTTPVSHRAYLQWVYSQDNWFLIHQLLKGKLQTTLVAFSQGWGEEHAGWSRVTSTLLWLDSILPLPNQGVHSEESMGGGSHGHCQPSSPRDQQEQRLQINVTI